MAIQVVVVGGVVVVVVVLDRVEGTVVRHSCGWRVGPTGMDRNNVLDGVRGRDKVRSNTASGRERMAAVVNVATLTLMQQDEIPRPNGQRRGKGELTQSRRRRRRRRTFAPRTASWVRLVQSSFHGGGCRH
jgi:hypothetical protein